MSSGMSHAESARRAARIVREVLDGLSVKAAAERYGITNRRVRQMLSKAGVARPRGRPRGAVYTKLAFPKQTVRTGYAGLLNDW